MVFLLSQSFQAESSNQKQMEDNRIKVGVIGLGAISQYWIAAIKKNLRYQLVAVCDVEEKDITFYSDYRQLLLNDDVHAVIIKYPVMLYSERNTCAVKSY